MATLRSEAFIQRPADEVWKVVNDAATISDWFPMIESSSLSGDRRTVVLKGGARVEEIVSSYPDLRRFQYRIVAGDVPVDNHLGTIDVLSVGGGTLVVYGTEIAPDDLASVVGPAVADAVQTLADRMR